MTTNTSPISVTYSDEKLRILVEEYITQQKNDFTFKGVCAYILYWAMEDGMVAEAHCTLWESDELQTDDKDRIQNVLDTIVKDGRIAATGENKYTIR